MWRNSTQQKLVLCADKLQERVEIAQKSTFTRACRYRSSCDKDTALGSQPTSQSGLWHILNLSRTNIHTCVHTETTILYQLEFLTWTKQYIKCDCWLTRDKDRLRWVTNISGYITSVEYDALNNIEHFSWVARCLFTITIIVHCLTEQKRINR